MRSQLWLVLALGLVPLAFLVWLLVGLRSNAIFLSGISYLIASAMAAVVISRSFPHPTIGYANAVTVFRLVVVASLLAVALSPANPWLVVVLATGALLLDGVDGYLARRHDRVSDFGARFDMEVDTALAVVLAVLAVTNAGLGVWVIALAMPRYLFVLAGYPMPWLRAALPYSFVRRVISVLQITALIILNAPLFDSVVKLIVAVLAAGVIAYSFGRDILWLFSRRRA